MSSEVSRASPDNSAVSCGRLPRSIINSFFREQSVVPTGGST
jgi:hypothetical protein